MVAQHIREWLDLIEAVTSNYLYHSTQDAATAKAILNSGYLKAGNSNQTATNAQTRGLATISLGRNIRYQLSGADQNRDYQVVFVIDRAKLEQRHKTIATSQSSDVRGLGWMDHVGEFKPQNLPQTQKFMKSRRKLALHQLDINKNGQIDPSEKKVDPDIYRQWGASRAGGEFEEVVPVKSGKLPLQGILVGFYLVPNKAAAQDPELVNHPLRLNMPRPNVFEPANPDAYQQAMQK